METFSAILVLCAWNSPVNSPHKGQWRGVLMFYLICALNKQLSKQWRDQWFETPSRSLWRYCNVPYGRQNPRYQCHWCSDDIIVADGVVAQWTRASANKIFNTLRPRQMDAISQTTFSNAFSWMKMFEFRLKFHWSLFLGFQLTIFQHWFRYWLGAVQATSHYLNQWWLVYWRIYASLSLNELISCLRIFRPQHKKIN